MSQPKLLIVVASTRPGRVGRPVGDWFTMTAREHGGFEVEEVDLAELALPLLDEPNHPRLKQYQHEHTKRWSAIVDATDAVVFVTPEYNHGYPAALKNAIDYLHEEWKHKPLGFVSYGGIAGGTRAVQQLKQVTGAVMLVSAQNSVNIAMIGNRIVDGKFVEDDGVRAAAKAMLDELLVLHKGLSVIRQTA
jgi:NAD(P)H-dependent FMN reductase